LCSVLALAATSSLGNKTSISGEQRQWHKVSLTFTGPAASESDSNNPFRNYRLNVTFKHAASGRTLVVPGYFAADGNASNTGASSGNKWRVEFAPDATGTWTYVASFRKGTDVAVSLSGTAGTGTSFDGEKGSFTVDATNKSGADFRAKGRLQEVGQHYLQHLGSKEYFIKAGAGSPENFLAYADFDNTRAGKKILHHYARHGSHYRSGDPTWKGGKGKNIIGALNYLAGKKMNAMYFLTMNIGGDGDDVFPYVSKTDVTRFDVSKLAQWEVVFSHMDRLGMYLDLVTQERENDQLLDGGKLGVQRKLYYRELVARFGHHLGISWNLGEENSNTESQRDAFADYINALDPYFHTIAVHTWPSERDSIYTPMLGDDLRHGASLQIESPSLVHAETLKWVKKSAATGDKWIVTLDEIGAASVGVAPDANDSGHADILHRALWGHLMAGGAGVDWYFGYNYSNHDLTCEDFTTRDRMWTLTHHAAQFFRTYLPLPLVANYDSITSSSADYCFGKAGVVYAIYLPDGATTNIKIPSGESYSVDWFNPRAGGSLMKGTVTKVSSGTVSVGRPPSETSKDWVALLRRSGTSAPAGADSAPVSGQPGTMAVAKFTLVDAAAQDDLRTLASGAKIDFAADGKALNVRADVNMSVGSVVFFLDGKKVRTENQAVYAFAGDTNGVYNKWTPPSGSHTLKAIPYSGGNGSGSVGTPLEITFTAGTGLSSSQPQEDEAVEDAGADSDSGPAVKKLVLLSASSRKDLRSLSSGGTIDLSSDGSALNLRAEVGGEVACVEFVLDGKRYRTENVAPFALAGDSNGNYSKWTPAVGSHTLKVIPYTGTNRSGTAGAALSITFKVQN
jgi:hypothetical protein